MIEVTLTWLGGSRRTGVETFARLPLRLGRAPECDVQCDAEADLKVSATHAELRSDGEDGLVVEDLGSKNGTLVNGAPTSGATALANHDVLQLGADGPRMKVTFVFHKDAPGAVSFGAMRKQQTGKLDPATLKPKTLATTDESPTYTEAELEDAPAPPAKGGRARRVVALVLVVVAVAAVVWVVVHR